MTASAMKKKAVVIEKELEKISFTPDLVIGHFEHLNDPALFHYFYFQFVFANLGYLNIINRLVS